jgi:hypothetical protein
MPRLRTVLSLPPQPPFPISRASCVSCGIPRSTVQALGPSDDEILLHGHRDVRAREIVPECVAAAAEFSAYRGQEDLYERNKREVQPLRQGLVAAIGFPELFKDAVGNERITANICCSSGVPCVGRFCASRMLVGGTQLAELVAEVHLDISSRLHSRLEQCAHS